ncbi:MAG: helicase-exonuclease AddAB subunit AddB [Clostridia bacterium]|nr:helicase-exonuclease AddAB subunit AddB [Clostridia bacterium]
MRLRFVIGRSGAGKTKQCLEEVTYVLKETPKGKYIYLVPEQASFHAEKSLSSYTESGGVIQAQVLSFQRLAWRVLQETGGGNYPLLDDVGKTLIIRRLLEKNKKNLKVFNLNIDSPGFLEQLVRGLSEMKIYQIDPVKLEKVVYGELEKEEAVEVKEGKVTEDELEILKDKEEMTGSLREKMEDFLLIYKEFEEYIEDQYLDTEDNLQLLIDNLHKSDYLEDAQIWVDGFNGFTPLEFEVIRQLILKCKQVNISICLDKELLNKKVAETNLFYQTWETYQRLKGIAEEVQCPLGEDVILKDPQGGRFREREDLAFLEESFSLPTARYAKKTESIQVKAAANRQEEVEEAAREIISFCREKGFRFMDIAVLLRDFSNYEGLIENIFRNYRIPFFLDTKKPLSNHPLLDLIQGSLEVVQNGWNYEPIFRCLKTDLIPVSRQEVDLLENYCLAHGIRGNRWVDERPWQYKRNISQDGENILTVREEKQLKCINISRKKAVQALLHFKENMKASCNGKEYSKALFDFLDELSIADKLERWTKQAEEEGRLEEARIHEQVWKKVLELLDKVVELLGEEEMTVREITQVVNSGLESMELGLIPPGLDQVLIGSVERSRNPDLKAVIILGVNEGVFPARVSDEGFFNDEERAVLGDRNIELAPPSVKRLFAEQFFVYKALTSASKFLTLSFAVADGEGKSLSPSSILKRLVEIFPQENYSLQPSLYDNDEKYICLPGSTISRLASNLRQAVEGKDINSIWWSVYNWYTIRDEWRKPLEKIVSGLFYEKKDDKLPHVLVKKLYGGKLYTSISRLEKFKACPFSHFLSYGIKLKERKEYKLGAPDLGQLFHKGLENFHGYLMNNQLVWGNLTHLEMKNIIDNVVGDVVPLLQNEVLLSTARYRYLTNKLKRILLRAVSVLGEHERRGTFRPLGVEITFGEKATLPGLNFKIADGTEIYLQGKIDRVDVARDDKEIYLRVIDYKSGMSSLSLLEIFYGLKLQLLTYLHVLLKYAPQFLNGEARPGGVLYFSIKDPFVIGNKELSVAEIEKKVLLQLKMKGYLLKDPEVIKLMDKDINGYSDLLPVALNKEGNFYKNIQSVLTVEEFDKLRVYVEKVLYDISSDIMSGNVAIAPYRYKVRESCTFCSYKSVCRFDPAVPGNIYRVLKDKSPDEIWHELGAEGGELEDE